MSNQALVCVTGASGFIAAHIVRQLLERGYTVRGTVRSLKKTEKYSYLTDLPGAAERLTLHAANLTEEGSYDQAIAGCTTVMHIASPYVIDVKDPQRDLVDPAVKGTLNVLRSAKAAGVKRVVLTSSMAAISDEPTDQVFTEADWNERSSLTRNPYYLSKVSAERAAWRFVETESAGFDLIAINPYMTHGPSLGPSLNSTNEVFRDVMTGAYPGVLDLNWGLVDVRDVALAHILAMENPDASGRYICAGETRTMREVIQIMKESDYSAYPLPSRNLTSGCATGVVKLLSYTQPSGVGSYMRTHLGKTMKYDNGKIRRELGIEFTPANESLPAMVEDLIRWGHLEDKNSRDAAGLTN